MMSKIIDTPALELKGGLYTLTAIRLYSSNPERITQDLENKIRQAPKFFYYAPIIIDLSQLKDFLSKDTEYFLQQLLRCIRAVKLLPVAIIPMQVVPEDFIQIARNLNMAIISESRSEIKHEPKIPTPCSKKKATPLIKEEMIPLPQLSPTRTIMQPVRSGQQLYAPNGDLLVLSSVSHGAELLADGHIHIYGPLRGRALAGISGNKDAHIFCQSLEAELVSIAGCYAISEDLKDHPLWKQPTKLFLENGKLQIVKLYCKTN